MQNKPDTTSPDTTSAVAVLTAQRYLQIAPCVSQVHLSVALLPRVATSARVQGDITVSFALRLDEASHWIISGEIMATMLLPCERCGAEVSCDITEPFEYQLAEGDVFNEDLPASVFAYQHNQLDLALLIDETLHLTFMLPVMHADLVACETASGIPFKAFLETAVEEEAKEAAAHRAQEHPFAGLKSLKQSN